MFVPLQTESYLITICDDINESTRAQLDAISTALAELQAKPVDKPRRPIGFIQPDDDEP